MKKIAIIGAGSAGILSTCHMISYLPTDWQVTLIHNPTVNSLGIGESTNPSFCNIIGTGIDFNLLLDIDKLDGTYKFGTQFSNWREHDIMNPLIGGAFAIHFDTHKFRDFAIPRLFSKWGNRFVEIQGNVTNLANCGLYASATVDNVVHRFDYVVDCTGFPKDYTDYTVSELPINHCLVHNVKTPGNWEFTGHRATRNGWMFEIPLTTRQSYGYLFNNCITTVEEARQDFALEINVPVEDLDTIEYKFTPYYANKIFDGRICKNGNAAMFFEPMSANSLWAYFNINALMCNYVVGHISDPEYVNEKFRQNAVEVESMIAYFYHGGSNYDTNFWKSAVDISTNILHNSEPFKRTQNMFRICREDGIAPAAMNNGWIFTASQLLTIEQEFNYNYFTK